MSSETKDETKSNRFARKKLTPFLAHEMIYDYVSGQLDPERRAALEAFIKSDHESQTILKNIQAAQAYAAKLSKVSVDSEILQQLHEAESAVSLGKRYSSWKEWPETLRWSITAIALSAIVAGSVALVPWSKLSPAKKAGEIESVEVAQIPQPKPEDTGEVASNEDEGSGDEPPEDSYDEGSGDDVADSGDEGGQPSAAALAAIAAAQKPTPTPAPEAGAVGGLSPGPQTPPAALGRSTPVPFVSVNLPQQAKTAAAKPTPTPAPSTNASSKLAISETPDSHAPGDAKARGFVYRAFMTLDHLEEIGPKITEDIVSLGGEKAGEVELGWKRGTGRYYHFALPEENEKKILERLQVYGPVRISKDPHPRVMPKGKVRFILWVESAPDSSGE